jgi:hypothetical protein
MMASNKDIKFYKGVLIELIRAQMSEDGLEVSHDEIDGLLKYRAGLFEVSCKDMTHEQMQDLKEWSKQFAASIGVNIKDQEELN